jgi:hypothetical protein
MITTKTIKLETLYGKVVICISCTKQYVYDDENKTSFLTCSRCRESFAKQNLQQIKGVFGYLLENLPRDSPLRESMEGLAFADYMQVLVECMELGYILADFNCRPNSTELH